MVISFHSGSSFWHIFFPADVIAITTVLVRWRIAQRKYAEAEELYRRALAISARTLANQANAYQSQGKYAEAEELYKRALAFLEKALGASHPDVAQTLNNLADVYRVQGRSDEADQLEKRATEIRRTVPSR